MMTKTQQILAGDTHDRMKRLVSMLAKKFQVKYIHYGISYDDILSEANQHYSKAVQSFDPTKGKLSSRVSYVVWCGLKKWIAKQCQRNARMPGEDLDLRTISANSRFDYGRFLNELSDDAKAVAKLAVEAPLSLLVPPTAPHKQDGRARRQNAVAEFLMELGWSVARVVESFNEIREALLT